MEASEQSGILLHVGVIERNFYVLKRCTDVSVYVIACLRAEGVLDDGQASSIKAERCPLLRSAMLYNWLKESKDISKYEEFLRVMEGTDVKQEHVANLLRGNTQGDLMPISEEKYTRLVKINPKLINASSGLRVGVDFLSHLISSDAISDTDYEDINIQKANYKRCDVLMTAIMRRSNRAFDLFRQALIDTKQEHFASYLDEGEVSGIHLNTSRPDLDGRLSAAFNTAIAEDHAHLSQLNGIGLYPIAAREGKSIEVFIYCHKVNNMETFIEAFNSNELQNILTSILNRLLLTIEPDNIDGIRAEISIDEEEVLALEKATGIEDWIQDESKIRRHHSKSVSNADVQCDLEDNKQSKRGGAHPDSEEEVGARYRLKRPLSDTEDLDCSPPKRRRLFGSQGIIPLSMEILPTYPSLQDSGEDLESKGRRWKSDEKYKTYRHIRQGNTLEMHNKVRVSNYLSKIEFLFEHEFDEDTLHKAVKEYLIMGYDYGKLRTIDALLKSGNVGAIFEMVCRIKPPKHERMDVKNYHLLESFVHHGINLNGSNENGETFLMIACENRRIDIVRLLLKLASHRFVLDMDAVDYSGETALMKATKNNDLEIIVALSGFKLISAVKDEKEKIVKSMIDVISNASDIFVKSWDSESSRFDMRRDKKSKFDIWENAMCIAMEKVGKHSEAILKLLLGCDIIFNAEAEIGYPLLHRVIDSSIIGNDKTNVGRLRLIEMLLKSGKINVNAKDEDGCTALHLARHEDLTSLLIRYGADVNKKDNSGNTPLMTGSLRGYKVSVLSTILYKAGAWVDLNAMDCNGRTALIIGAMRKNSDVVELLINAGASVNLFDHLGLTALHHALCGNITELEAFPRNSEELKSRKEITTILFDSEKLLEHCLWFRRNENWNRRRMKIVEMLLRRSDVDVNALSFEKFSPLDMAEGRILQIPPSIDDALKEKGTALNVFKHAESKTGEFHLDVRCRLTLQRIVCKVVTKNAKTILKGRLLTLIETFQKQLVSGKDRQGRTALHLFAISLSLISPVYHSSGEFFHINENYRRVLAKEIMNKIISLGCNVNEVDKYGRTALHYADEVLSKLLIAKGADALVKEEDGNSKTDAASLRALDIVRALYKRNEETLFLRIMNNKKLEINVKNCDSPDRRSSEELKSKGIPKLLWKDGEYAFSHPLVKQITNEVMDLMDVIAKEIERLDPRFAIRPVLVGSSTEGTKLGKPDQFDFYFVLTQISELCEVSQSPELPTGFVRIKRKLSKVDETKENDFDGLFEKDGILNTAKLDWQFRTILMNAVIYIESQQSFDFNLEMRKSRINSHSNMLTNSWDTIQKASNIKMFKPLNVSSVNIISIDIVPCIHVDGWWPDETKPNVSEDIKMFGCNLVFESPHKQYPWVPYSDSCAKISFAKTESDTIKQTCITAKEAYMIGKTMIKKTEWHYFKPFIYTLKHCLLYCIEALTPTSEKASKLGLSLEELESKFHQMDRYVWLRCLMKCYLDFVAQDFCPCYFLPNLSLPTGKEYLEQREYLKHFSWGWMRNDNDRFPDCCRKAYAFYCCTSNDISKSCCQLPAPDPLWERFDRDQMIANLFEIAYKVI